jgi:hypothetical protein
MEFVVTTKNSGILPGKSQNTRTLGPNCAADGGPTQQFTNASTTKLLSHGCVRTFPAACLKKTLRGKALEDEERSKVTSHSNLYRCTKQTTGGASSSGSASGVSLSKENGSGTSWRKLQCSWFHSISPGASWSGLVKNIWILSPTDGVAVFTTLTF